MQKTTPIGSAISTTHHIILHGTVQTETMTDASCNESYLTDPLEPQYCEADNWLLVLEAVYIAVVTVCSLIGNFFVLFLVAKNKELRYRSIMVSLSVVATDILLVGVYHIPALVSVVSKGWIFGYISCQVFGIIGFYLLYVRWMAMTVIALDRVSYILFPMSYNRWSKPYLITLTIAAWSAPFFMHVPSMAGVGTYSLRPGFSLCIIDCGIDRFCYILHITIFSVQLTVGGILPAGLYITMYCYSRAKRRQIRLGLQTYLPEIDQQAPLPPKWSKQDLQALITFLIIVVTLIITNIPVYLTTIMRRSFPTFYSSIPLWSMMLIINIFYISNVLDPILIMRNRDFNKAIVRLFSRKSLAYRSSSLSTLRRTSVCHYGNSHLGNGPIPKPV